MIWTVLLKQIRNDFLKNSPAGGYRYMTMCFHGMVKKKKKKREKKKLPNRNHKAIIIQVVTYC